MVYSVEVEAISTHLVTQAELTKLEEVVQDEEVHETPVVEATPSM